MSRINAFSILDDSDDESKFISTGKQTNFDVLLNKSNEISFDESNEPNNISENKLEYQQVTSKQSKKNKNKNKNKNNNNNMIESVNNLIIEQSECLTKSNSDSLIESTANITINTTDVISNDVTINRRVWVDDESDIPITKSTSTRVFNSDDQINDDNLNSNSNISGSNFYRKMDGNKKKSQEHVHRIFKSDSFESSNLQNIQSNQLDQSDNWVSVADKRKTGKNRKFGQSEQNEIINADGIKKKSFNAPLGPRKEELKLPAYYQTRSSDSNYVIYPSEYDWVKSVGGLEKSADKTDALLSGILYRAIDYCEKYSKQNKLYAKFNPEFKNGRIVIDENLIEEKVDLVLRETLSIVIHRLIKSDSKHAIASIIGIGDANHAKNIPLYRILPFDSLIHTPYEHSESTKAFLRLKRKYIDDLKISQNLKKIYNSNDVNAANLRIKTIENRWNNYILQSVWNGNNPIHDCLYYGAIETFTYLISHYYKKSMFVELNEMMSVPNALNETHLDIIKNGRTECEKRSDYIIREKHFHQCSVLYNRTIISLRAHMDSLIQSEADNILSKTITTENSDATNQINQINQINQTNQTNQTNQINQTNANDFDGDNLNVCGLITTCDIEGMINHITKCAARPNGLRIVKKTFELWQSTVESDLTHQYEDYLEDVKYQTKDIYDAAFA